MGDLLMAWAAALQRSAASGIRAVGSDMAAMVSGQCLRSCNTDEFAT